MNFFYHGTSISCVNNSIKTEGLLPRKFTNKSNFSSGKNIASNKNLVYMTNNKIFSEFYMFRSALANNDYQTSNIIIDSSKLIENNLRIDENYLCKENNCHIKEKFVEKAEQDKRWKESISKTRLFSYLGNINSDCFIDIEIHSIYENKFYDEELFHVDEKEDRLLFHDYFMIGMHLYASYSNFENITKEYFQTDIMKKWIYKGYQFKKTNIFLF